MPDVFTTFPTHKPHMNMRLYFLVMVLIVGDFQALPRSLVWFIENSQRN